MDFVGILTAAAGGGGMTYVGQLAAGWIKARSERAHTRESNDVVLEQHRDKLTFELLTAAREEVAAARVEAVELRAIQLRLTHLEEALDHVQALCDASDMVAVMDAQRRARQFLVRMKRISEARGAVLNEAQIMVSRERLEGANE